MYHAVNLLIGWQYIITVLLSSAINDLISQSHVPSVFLVDKEPK